MKDNSNNDISDNDISNNNIKLHIIDKPSQNKMKIDIILLSELNKIIYEGFNDTPWKDTPLLKDISNNTSFKDISNNITMKKKSSRGILKIKNSLDDLNIKPTIKGVKKITGSHRTALKRNLQNYEEVQEKSLLL